MANDQTPRMKRGFTLIELLLYVGIAGFLVFIFGNFLFLLLTSRTKSQTIDEVNQQARYAMQLMLQSIRNAQTINAPGVGATSFSLSLDVPDPTKDPIVFDLSGGALRMSEGLGSPIPLTSSRVLVSDLTFQNLSRPNTPGTIRIQFTLEYVNPENRNEYRHSKIFSGSASLR